MEYKCSKCLKRETTMTNLAMCECGGLWQLDQKQVYFDEGKVDQDALGIFRYRAFMPLMGETWRSISMGEGMTPIISYDSNAALKMDYMMPTLSFKDRGSAVLMAHLKAIGVKRVVQDSSGNAGKSIAAYAARAGIACEIFVPSGTAENKIDKIKSFGADVTVVEGTRDHCAEVCRQKVSDDKVYYASHVYNPFFYEGTKTYLYEVYETLKRLPKYLFVPVGNGTLLIGILRAIEDLMRTHLIKSAPKVVMVQSACCAPLAISALKQSKVPAFVTPQFTLAEGIAIGKPMRGMEILEGIAHLNGDAVMVSEQEIEKAHRLLAQKGIYCEMTTAATFAGYLKYCDAHGQITDVLIPICASN